MRKKIAQKIARTVVDHVTEKMEAHTEEYSLEKVYDNWTKVKIPVMMDAFFSHLFTEAYIEFDLKARPKELGPGPNGSVFTANSFNFWYDTKLRHNAVEMRIHSMQFDKDGELVHLSLEK